MKKDDFRRDWLSEGILLITGTKSIFKRSGCRFALRKCDKAKIESCFLIPWNLKTL